MSQIRKMLKTENNKKEHSSRIESQGCRERLGGRQEG